MEKHLTYLHYRLARKRRQHRFVDSFTRFGGKFLESCRGLSSCFPEVVAEFFGELSGSFRGAVGEFPGSCRGVFGSAFLSRNESTKAREPFAKQFFGNAGTICKKKNYTAEPAPSQSLWNGCRVVAAAAEAFGLRWFGPIESRGRIRFLWRARHRCDEIGRRDRRSYIIYSRLINISKIKHAHSVPQTATGRESLPAAPS